MAVVVTVTYEDGRSDSVRLLPIGLVLAERHFKGALPPMEGSLYATWALLKPGIDFEAWLGTITNATEVAEEDTAPLPEGPPPEQ